MPKRKLTDRLKAEIKANYRNLRQADFDGDALRYLKQVRGAAKGRRAQGKIREAKAEKVRKAIPTGDADGKGKPITIAGVKHFPGSKIYEIVKVSAANTGMSVSKFVKENKDNLETLVKNYLIFSKKEIDDLRKLIKQLPDESKVISPVRHGGISRKYASFLLHTIKKTMIELAPVYPYIFIEYAFDLDANLHFACPRPNEYQDIEDGEELLEWIDDRYPNITYIRNDGNNDKNL